MISFRPYHEFDADELVAAVRESVGDLMPWMVWCRADYAHEHALAWIRHTQLGHQSGTCYEFAIFDDTGRYAGGCGVNHVNNVDRVANLGYWIRTSCIGRGLATYAAREIASWTFANTSLNRLEIVAAVGNARSRRVAAKVPAVEEAVLRQRLMVQGSPSDAVLFSVIRNHGTNMWV